MPTPIREKIYRFRQARAARDLSMCQKGTVTMSFLS
jgi:hypothetical protein